jgi:AcrR family transcriptional regulator
MPRPRSLTLDDIGSAALAVLERAGPAGLTMRAVAAELGTGTMSLYRYVRGREQVEALVLDRVLDAVDTETPPGTPWADRIALLAERVRATVGDHPAVVPLLLTNRHRAPGTIRWGEAVMGALGDAGLAGGERVVAFRAVVSYVLGAIQVEHLGPLSGPGTAALAALPRDHFPHLADAASHAAGIPPEEEFRRGLALLLRGLAGGGPGTQEI